MKLLLSHPTGNANVRAIADGLLARSALYEFHTSIAAFPGNGWDRLGNLPLLTEFSRRKYNPGIRSYTRQNPWRELGRTFFSKMKWEWMIEHEIGCFSVDMVYKEQDRGVARRIRRKFTEDLCAVYAYEDGALETFKRAKNLGIKCIYDLPIAYWETGQKLMKEEAERLPEWACTLGGGICDSEEKLDRKRKELELADVVVGPGSFVMDSLPSWAKNKKQIISPFGSPALQNIRGQNIKRKDPNLPLRVLFVGSMGQRKGLGDLFQAMSLFNSKNIELVILGTLKAPMKFYRGAYANFTYEPGRPNNEVLKLMKSCDVLCLPSIVEGRALVMQEAMSQGLPLIITPNTGGEDLIIEGETGFLVPIRSPEAIAEKLEWLLSNRSLLPEMSQKAIEISQKYTWKKYGDDVVNGVLQYLKN